MFTSAGNVELLANTEVRELMGGDHLDGVVVEDNRSGARRTLGARALFFFIGAEANTGWLEGAVELDQRGFVLTGRELVAAGDVRSGSIKRVASAVGEGSMTVRLVHQYLADTGV